MTKSDWQLIHKIYRQLRNFQGCTAFDAMCASYQAWKINSPNLDAAKAILSSIYEFDLQFSREVQEFAAPYRPELFLSSQGRWIFGSTLVRAKPGSILKMLAQKEALVEFERV